MSEAVRAVTVSPAMVQQRAADLVKSDAQVLVMRARPEWFHGDVTVDGVRVTVVPGRSQLGILDTYASLAPDEHLVVLTDRPREDLGDAVLARAYKQTIDLPDEWAAVPRLFPGAGETSRELRRLDWAATALLDHQPTGGWPRSPEPALTARHAIGALLAHVLGMDPTTELDSVVLLTSLGRRETRAWWASVDPTLQKNLIDWASATIGAPAALALTVAGRHEHVTPLAVALVLDVLWPDDGKPPEEPQVSARVRVERYIDGTTVGVADAKATAQMARTAVLRLGSEDSPELGVALQQAEALLADLGWAEGSERSSILRPGYGARLHRLAAALDAGDGFETALGDVRAHRQGEDCPAPTMAVRLARWLATTETTTESLAADLQRQIDEGAWVDAAVGAVWNGSEDPVVAASYQRLIERVRERRHHRDRLAANRLEEVASGQARPGEPGTYAMGVERLLVDVVDPWRRQAPVLMVVLDGMSSAIATTLASDAARLGLVEWVPSATRARLPVAAALPSLTRVSRTSLFCGEVCEGSAEDEKKGLARRFPGARVFHKGDLRSDGGAALPEEVSGAIADEHTPVVGVVINAIDDAMHKNDTSGSEWTLRQVEPLRALLDAAVAARRTVVVTSDHGHVVERDTEALSVDEAEARWRPAATGEPAAGEVLVTGPRTVAPAGEAVLLWREGAHYGPRSAGYHGGASLAELTIPALVFQPGIVSDGIHGWEPATPQAPEWWNDPAPRAAEPSQKQATAPRVSPREPEPVDEGALFAAPRAQPAAEPDLVEAVLSSTTYSEQRRMAGRGALPNETVSAVLATLVGRDGRAHQDTVAAVAGIPTTQVGQVLAGVRRLLNVDGYPVIETDADGVTLHLDVSLLRDQFDLGSAP